MSDQEIIPQSSGLTLPVHLPQAETASTAVAAQARAQVQARYAMAYQRPRDWNQVRVSLLHDCERPGFAAVAKYLKPIGKGVTGPSIRFAEAAMRHMTNILAEAQTVFDDREKRIVRITATDLESNISHFKDIVIEKTVERSSLKPGQSAITSRINSQGKTVHLVAATEDDLLNKEAALASKALRGLALRLLPGDILEECMERVDATLSSEVARDPDAERKKLADAFAAIGVMPTDLKTYLGHPIEQIHPSALVELRAVYAAIKEGETSWAESLEHKIGKAQKKEGEAPKTLGDLTKPKGGAQ